MKLYKIKNFSNLPSDWSKFIDYVENNSYKNGLNFHAPRSIIHFYKDNNETTFFVTEKFLAIADFKNGKLIAKSFKKGNYIDKVNSEIKEKENKNFRCFIADNDLYFN